MMGNEYVCGVLGIDLQARVRYWGEWMGVRGREGGFRVLEAKHRDTSCAGNLVELSCIDSVMYYDFVEVRYRSVA